MKTKDQIFNIAKIIANSKGFELVFNEELESAHFLKHNGKRFERDLELYNFMSEIIGVERMVTMFLEEIVLPSKVEEAINTIKNWGLEIYPIEQQQMWLNIFS